MDQTLFWRLQRQPLQLFDFWCLASRTVKISFHCFKLPNLWHFVTVILGSYNPTTFKAGYLTSNTRSLVISGHTACSAMSKLPHCLDSWSMLFSTATTNFSQAVPVTFSISGSLQRVPEVYEMFGKPEVSFFKRKKNSLILNLSPRMTLKGLEL